MGLIQIGIKSKLYAFYLPNVSLRFLNLQCENDSINFIILIFFTLNALPATVLHYKLLKETLSVYYSLLLNHLYLI